MNKQSATAVAKQAARKNKKLKLVNEEVVLADGSSFTPLPVKDKGDVLHASLLMLFKHVADIHYAVVEIIAEKFGHTVEDVRNAIVEDPRWEKMLADPMIVDLTETVHKQAVPPPKQKKKVVIQTSDEPELVFD